MYILMEKRCCTCRVVKKLDDFHKDKRKPCGRCSRCKSCKSAYASQRRKELMKDPEYADRVRKKKRQYKAERMKNDPEYAERMRKYKREYQAERMKNDPEYAERMRKYKREYQAERMKNDPEFKRKQQERMKAWAKKHNMSMNDLWYEINEINQARKTKP